MATILSNILVDSNTSVLLLDTNILPNNNDIVVLLSNNYIPGRIVSVRDTTGFLSTTKRIIVSTTSGVSFLNGTSSVVLNQPFAFITVANLTEDTWVLQNTFAFPAEESAASLITLTAHDVFTSTAYVYDKVSTTYLQVSSLNTLTNIVIQKDAIINKNLFVNTTYSNTSTSVGDAFIGGAAFVTRHLDIAGNATFQGNTSMNIVNMYGATNLAGPATASNLTVNILTGASNTTLTNLSTTALTAFGSTVYVLNSQIHASSVAATNFIGSNMTYLSSLSTTGSVYINNSLSTTRSASIGLDLTVTRTINASNFAVSNITVANDVVVFGTTKTNNLSNYFMAGFSSISTNGQVVLGNITYTNATLSSAFIQVSSVVANRILTSTLTVGGNSLFYSSISTFAPMGIAADVFMPNNTINLANMTVSSISTTGLITTNGLSTNTLNVNRQITFGNATLITATLLSTLIVQGIQAVVSSIMGDGSQLYNLNAVSTQSIQSTIAGLGTYGYISSLELRPTSADIANSTMIGLGSAGYISSQQIRSTVAGLGQTYVSTVTLFPFNITTGVSTNILYAGNAGGTQTQITTTGILGEVPLLTTAPAVDFFSGDATSVLYNARTQNFSMSFGISNDNTARITATGTDMRIGGTGKVVVGSELWIARPLTNYNNLLGDGITRVTGSNISTTYMNATVGDISSFIGFGHGQISSLASSIMLDFVPSSLIGLGTLGYISSATLNSSLQSTVQGLGTYGYVSTLSLYSSQTGLGTLGYVSTLSMISSLIGLGTLGYISSATLNSSLQSTVQGLGTYGYVSTLSLYSSQTGLGTIGYVSTLSMTSTIVGLGTFGYVSTPSMISTIVGLGTFGYISAATLNSTTKGIMFAVSTIVNSYYATAYSGTILYLNNSVASGAYKALQSITSEATSGSSVTPLGPGASATLAGSFLTDFGIPTFIPAGFWDINLYASADTGTDVLVYATLTLVRAAGGSVVIASTATYPTNVPSTKTELNVSLNLLFTDCAPGDKLLLQFYGKNTDTENSHNLTLYFEGDGYSHMHTTYGTLIPEATLASTVNGLGHSRYVSTAAIQQGFSTLALFTSNTSNYIGESAKVSSLESFASSIGIQGGKPFYPLDVYGSGGTADNARFTGSVLFATDSGATGAKRTYGRITGTGTVAAPTSGTLAIQGTGSNITFTPAAFFNSNIMTLNTGTTLANYGFVGINCNSPQYQLDINGNQYITGNLSTTGTVGVGTNLMVRGTTTFHGTARFNAGGSFNNVAPTFEAGATFNTTAPTFVGATFSNASFTTAAPTFGAGATFNTTAPTFVGATFSNASFTTAAPSFSAGATFNNATLSNATFVTNAPVFNSGAKFNSNTPTFHNATLSNATFVTNAPVFNSGATFNSNTPTFHNATFSNASFTTAAPSFSAGATFNTTAPIFNAGATFNTTVPTFVGATFSNASFTTAAPTFGAGATFNTTAPVFNAGATFNTTAPSFPGGATFGNGATFSGGATFNTTAPSFSAGAAFTGTAPTFSMAVTFASNVTAVNFIGNGSQLTNLPAGTFPVTTL